MTNGWLNSMTVRTRHTIDEMALALLMVPELNSDADCLIHLHFQGFRPSEIDMYFTAARGIARDTRAGKGDLWMRLLPKEKDPDT